ncbi:MAG: N-acetylmuramoyl-L-alanine amidase [Bacteroidetes bacterium]|nr:N-acetylmuramoyl-L-alanine amidase [Bacteroidota bacterium]|tara:strand:- start:773 stop:1477 length:705 start_codon:yes stop_codon:yes gene_type:complete
MDKTIKCPNCGTEYDLTVTQNNPTPKSNYLWIFDNGHGGIIDGVYQTPGKRSPVWPDGTQLFEGEFNRAIVNRLVKMCNEAGIEYINLVDTQEDISLSERVKTANQIAKSSSQKCIYVSVHANGFSSESANGWSVYTSVGETKSDDIATILFEKALREFPGEYMRKDTYSDGDVDQESNFYVLINTSMPAILSENFFMTNSDNCHKYLLSEEGRDRIAKVHFQMIQEVESSKIV